MPTAAQDREQPQLNRSLRNRHMSMIAIGGAIGAGLFVGSGSVIKTAGPAAIISYCLAGALVLCTMRMLGEMVVARPSTGSFSDYARSAIGPWAGFTIGWLYWYYYVIIVAVEAVAGAAILHNWLDVPLWVLAMGLMAVMTATNLFSVKSFGEFEFWFSSVKVAAIVAFLIVGGLHVFGAWPGSSLDFSHLTSHGGFAPNGSTAIFSAIVVVIFAFGGAEIVTIAAAESKEPQRSVARATTGIIWRIILFYVGSIVLVVTIVPWDSAKVLASPYVAAWNAIGLKGAGTVMDVVILTAVLSVLNSSVYVSSRMLFALASHGDAPKWSVKTNKRQVPVRAILAGTAVGWISVILAYLSPDTVFSFLVNSSGAVAIFMYLMIGISQLRMRRRLEREDPGRLTLRMWLFPYLTWLVMAGFAAVLVAMAVIDDQRAQLFTSLGSLAVVLLAYAARRAFGPRSEPAPQDTADSATDRATQSVSAT
ncbi:amino acid permease [Streptomyces iconiensis]|uniref:Amino acid permease n=1 Tax=Streptomyces iconiensis TaxID=1384038 RepID=A0ABT6ZTR4_9ACTN|nr:amino acid permease [Streptomyces iconiensis]MDJ1132026.1 amino acid permease [Streptomyces iconiensis]